MRLIGLAVVLAVSLNLAPLAAEAQQAGKPRQVGYLNVGSREPFAQLLIAFEERMAELGYVRGKDVLIVSRFADGPADLARLADELVRLKADLLLVQGNVVVAAARQATTTIPIVMARTTDPVGAGFIASLSRSDRDSSDSRSRMRWRSRSLWSGWLP